MTTLVRTEHGTVEISDGAFSQLVLRAAGRVEGARVRRPRRGLQIHSADGRARVGLEIVVDRGVVLPEVARAIQESVAQAVEQMCGLQVEAVDVAIEGLAT
jgi:uncharacterized alkaline shock family protein YloU